MTHLPFTVFKRATQPSYLVKFKDEITGKYNSARSTGKATKAEATKIAFEWLKNGIPSKGESLDFETYSLRNMIKQAELTKSDAAFIVENLKCRGLLKSYVLFETKQAQALTSFLLNFWDWETSPYIKERLRKKHSIHRSYSIEMTGIIKKYWIPFFDDKILGEVTRSNIEEFISYLETLPKKAEQEQAEWERNRIEQEEKEKAEIAAGIRNPKRKNAAKSKNKVFRFPKSAKKINTIIQAGTIPLAWAFNKEIIDSDVTKGITWFAGKAAERQILSPDQASAIFRIDWKDERSRLANMLSMVTGIRAGEIQGLRIQDLGKDCLYIRHSWNAKDKLKTTKNNESRMVEVPFPGLMQDLIELAKRNPHRQDMDGYVFWAELSRDKPMEQDIFLRDLRSSLVIIGMSKESAQVYTFHGWRHFFTSYMREMVNEKLLQRQTGHKTLQMLDHYSNHMISGDRERLRTAQLEAFSEFLPEDTNYIREQGAIR
jgi:integrase